MLRAANRGEVFMTDLGLEDEPMNVSESVSMPRFGTRLESIRQQNQSLPSTYWVAQAG
jgi:hypothetical protein